MESLWCTDFPCIAAFKLLAFYNIRRQAKSKHEKQGCGAISEISDKGTEIQGKPNVNVLPSECTQVLN